MKSIRFAILGLFAMSMSAFGSARFDQRLDETASQQKIKEIVVSEAVVVNLNSAGEQIPVCRMDVAGRPDLVPHFMKPAAHSEPGVALPVCNAEQAQAVSFVAAVGSLPVYASIGVVSGCVVPAFLGGGLTALYGGDYNFAVAATKGVTIGSMLGAFVGSFLIVKAPFARSLGQTAVAGVFGLICGGGSAMIVYKISHPN